MINNIFDWKKDNIIDFQILINFLMHDYGLNIYETMIF
jgi:hypothetical protein